MSEITCALRALWAGVVAAEFSQHPALAYQSLKRDLGLRQHGDFILERVTQADITDLLVDLHHLADAKDLSWDLLQNVAAYHYAAERANEAERIDIYTNIADDESRVAVFADKQPIGLFNTLNEALSAVETTGIETYINGALYHTPEDQD